MRKIRDREVERIIMKEELSGKLVLDCLISLYWENKNLVSSLTVQISFTGHHDFIKQSISKLFTNKI